MSKLLLRGSERIWNCIARKYLFPIVTVSCAILFSMTSTLVVAEVRITGSKEGMILKTNNATLPEIVSVIKSELKLNINISGSMPRIYDGVYSGSVRHVLSRLLSGTDHIIKTDLAGIYYIVLLGKNRNIISPDSQLASPKQGHQIVNPVSAAELNPMGIDPTTTSFSQPASSVTVNPPNPVTLSGTVR